MKTTTIVLTGAVALLAAGAVWAAPVASERLTLFTASGFVEQLITRGIIPESLAPKARELVGMVSKIESKEQSGPMNADKVQVSVSQYIQSANLTFNQVSDITGIILLVKNTTDAPILLEARRKCQVTYKIYSTDGTLLFDGNERDVCRESTETVTYQLEAGKTRIFDVRHSQNDYHLDAGTYRFVVEYPGYGSGERTVKIEG